MKRRDFIKYLVAAPFVFIAGSVGLKAVATARRPSSSVIRDGTGP